jgi:two-component system OmpR family sensor kinase
VSEDQLGEALRDLLRQVQAVSPAGPAGLQQGDKRVATAAAALQAAVNQHAEDKRQLAARNAELEREVQARDELLSVIGHELRNPISPLFMHVKALLLEVRSADNGKVDAQWLVRRLERFERPMQRFLSVLDRILDLSRLSAGQVELQLERIDITEVVREIVGRYAHEAAASGCELRVTQPGSVFGTWDRLRVEQIVSNLVSNAIRYGANAPVDVKVTANDTLATIEVRDRGVGIAPEDHARIFERFERARRRGQGGFGVGLWVVKSLCDALDGEVSVDSALGQGATFRVSLPRGVTAKT